MTNEQIEAIRIRAEKATKGPWERFNVSDVFTELGATNNEGITAEYNDGWSISSSADGLTFVDGELTTMSTDEQMANAEFIANARQDIPALLTEIERLRGALKKISYVYEDTGELAYDQRGMYVIAKTTLEETSIGN